MPKSGIEQVKCNRWVRPTQIAENLRICPIKLQINQLNDTKIDKISRFFKRTPVNLSIPEPGMAFALETYAIISSAAE
jgi:hypothetical protein